MKTKIKSKNAVSVDSFETDAEFKIHVDEVFRKLKNMSVLVDNDETRQPDTVSKFEHNLEVFSETISKLDNSINILERSLGDDTIEPISELSLENTQFEIAAALTNNSPNSILIRALLPPEDAEDAIANLEFFYHSIWLQKHNPKSARAIFYIQNARIILSHYGSNIRNLLELYLKTKK